MPVQVGDKVKIEGWDSQRSFYIRDCAVVVIQRGNAVLEEESITFLQGDDVKTLPGGGSRITVPVAYLEIPFEERWQKNIDDMRRLAQKMLGARMGP